MITRLAAALAALVLPLSAAPATSSGVHHEGEASLLGPNQVVLGHVPWNQVGPGWYLTVIDQGPDAKDVPGIVPQHQLLDLVNPRGGRYQLLKTATGPHARHVYQLAGWSTDGQVALLFKDAQTRRARAVQVDLKYGTTHVTHLGNQVASIALGPHGSVYASSFGDQSGESLVRIDTDGTRHQVAGHTDGESLPTPDGTQVVVASGSRTSHAFRVVTADGHVIRTLDLPSHCFASRWWRPGVVMASCWEHQTSLLYGVPTDGSKPFAISRYHGKHSRDLGDIDAQRLDGTTYLEASGPCGYVFLAQQHADGSATPVQVPHTEGNVYLLGTQPGHLVLQHAVSCDSMPPRDAITHFDPSTGHDTVVARLPLHERYGAVLAFGEGHGLQG